MQFPMFVVSVAQLLKMTEVRPHEILKDEGIAVEYEESMGKAAFISHEWVGDGHPDPEFKQLSVLQDALTYMMSDLQQIPQEEAGFYVGFPNASPVCVVRLFLLPLLSVPLL